MGEPQALSQRIGLTRGKTALIGGLAVALVGVVYVQYGRSNGDEVAAHATDSALPQQAASAASLRLPASTVAEQQATTNEESALAAAFDPVRWKSPELSSIVAYDPFALPESFPQPPPSEIDPQLVLNGGTDASTASADADKLAEVIEQLRMELEVLQQRGVQVIVRGRDNYVAMIGDRMVHVGDEFNGFTVTAIDSDGVRVERKVDQ